MLSSHAVLVGEIWPWVVQDIERGCVERTYMSYLLSSDPSLLSLGRYRMHVLQVIGICDINKRLTNCSTNNKQQTDKQTNKHTNK